MNQFHWHRSGTHGPGKREHRSNSPWREAKDPQRILIIRFHALGDVALTFPACLGLRKRYPDAQIDFLTSPEAASLVQAIDLFNRVFTCERRAKRGAEIQDLFATSLRLRHEHYEVVLDLQRNWKSRWIRLAVRPESWSEFDRFSPEPACERTVGVFREAGFQSLVPRFEQHFTRQALQAAEALLRSFGWQPDERLVLFNPAGLWESRNWPLEYYAQLAQLWPDPKAVRFLLLGTQRLRPAAAYLTSLLGDRLIAIIGRTSPGEALAVLRFAETVITEDSGLMHMAWSLGKPIVALFGSSRHYWSLPTGMHVRAFHSGDLPCAACMQPQCRFGDNRCLTRVTPEAVLREALSLMTQRSLD